MLRLNRYLILVMAVMLLSAIGRLYHIDRRPMHTDEAVHAVKFSELLSRNYYRYDPHEYHGPSLYYLSLPIALLRGETTPHALRESTLRLVPIVASLLFFIPLLSLKRLTSGPAILLAALAAAISPIITYYSRYYIHETLLAGFMFAALSYSWVYLNEKRPAQLFAAAAFFGLALSSKETVVLSLASAGIALFTTAIIQPQQRQKWFSKIPLRHILIATIITTAIAILLYTSFFSNPHGIIDFARAYTHTLSRAGGQGHEKPWFYYFKILVFFKNGRGLTASEAAFMFGTVVTAIYAIRSKRLPPELRSTIILFSIYSFALLAIYSALPYKMPWLALNWMQPMTFITAVGLSLALRRTNPLWLRIAVGTVAIAASLNLLHQIKLENGRLRCDERNPYVYAHTSPDFLRLPAMIKDATALTPQKDKTTIAVISDEYWPIPWYLRDFPNIGYWHTVPDKLPDTPIIIASLTAAEKIYPQLEKSYTCGIYGLHNGVLLEAFVRNDLWQLYLEQKCKQ